MISLASPHMGVNDPRAPVKVRMWNTWNIKKAEKRAHIVNWVAAVARTAPGGRLKNVVFSCHGSAASLQMGQGFKRAHAGMFRAWAGLVDKVWFRACSVARIQKKGSNGHLFCSEVARAAKCYVVASTEFQVDPTGRVLPYGQLDTFEGLLLSYGPDGKPSWSKRYVSTYQRDPKNPNSWVYNPG
jgi:hypothetical protein